MALPPTPLCPLPLAFGYCHHPFLHPDLLSPFCDELKSYLSSTMCKWFFASSYLLLRVVLVFFASSQAFFFFLSLLYFAVSFFLLRMVLVRAEVMSAGAKTGPARRTVAGTFFRVLGYSSYLGTAYSSTASTRKNRVFAYYLEP